MERAGSYCSHPPSRRLRADFDEDGENFTFAKKKKPKKPPLVTGAEDPSTWNALKRKLLDVSEV